MKSKLGVILIISLLAITLNSPAEVIGKDDETVKAVAAPMLDNIIDGIKTNDYAKYSRNFEASMKEAVPRKMFHEVNQMIRKDIGNYASREYLGFLNQKDMTIILWKSRFDKTEDDILIRLIIAKRGSKYEVIGFWFQ